MLSWSQLNFPFHEHRYGKHRRIFFSLEINATAVGGITGTTYDPTNHLTTRLDLSEVSGRSLKDSLGVDVNKIDKIFFGVSGSDANAATSGGTSNDVAKFKAQYIKSGKYIKFIMVGPGADNAAGGNDEGEMTNAAGALSSTYISGYMIVRT